MDIAGITGIMRTHKTNRTWDHYRHKTDRNHCNHNFTLLGFVGIKETTDVIEIINQKLPHATTNDALDTIPNN